MAKSMMQRTREMEFTLHFSGEIWETAMEIRITGILL